METVDELTGYEGGVWRVTTVGSTHIINLISGTVTRLPGIGRNASINDRSRPLRSIEACRVGDVGHWTMISDDYLTDYYWQRTSTIQRIERLHGLELGIANTEIALQNIASVDGLYPVPKVAELLDMREEEVREMLGTDQLIALNWKGELVLPGVQFGGETRQVLPFVAPLIAAANHWNYSLRGLTFWLYAPTTYFDGDIPGTYVNDPDRLVTAFEAHAGVEW